MDSENIKLNIVPIVENDLKKSGILRKISNFEVMDVGTGRQSLALAMCGAKSINHFDISKEHVRRFRSLLSERYASLPITMQYKDLCRPPYLTREQFDFVYLNGIVHHFSDTSVGLKNCAAAVKKHGRIWVYFYRSGTFKWFVCSMIRALTDAAEIDTLFCASGLQFSEGDTANLTTSRIMDDFFAPYIHLYSPFDYIEFMDRLGFHVFASNDIDPLSEVNHDLLHHSATLVFERIDSRDIADIDTGAMLSPQAARDQLDDSIYDDDRPKKSIELFRNLQERLERRNDSVITYSLRLAMHRIAAGQYYGGAELPPNYEALDRMLKAACEALA